MAVRERYATGRPCDQAHALCRQELSKAIALCPGRTPNLLHIHTP